MKIVVLGLGYVGCVTAACLLKLGHTVVGVEVDGRVRNLVANGKSPIHEPDVGDLIAQGHAAGRLTVVTDMADAAEADLVIVCVGTPGQTNGALDLSAIRAATVSVGAMLRARRRAREAMLIVFRSTMLPGSMTDIVLPAIAAAAGEGPGSLYDVAYNPEFIRLGSAVTDYFAPARIIIGERLAGTAQPLLDLHASIDAPVFRTTFETAELAKYADNAFHALKVAYANEIGRLAVRSGISPAELFELFCADDKLNLSARYLRPGGAFGGPCLPKDVRALGVYLDEVGIAAPVLRHILKSNEAHTEFLIAEIERRVAPRSRILLMGLSFKPGSGELRESPLVTLAQTLLDRGHDLAVYDPDIARANGGDGLNVGLAPEIAAITLGELPEHANFDLVVVGKMSAAVAEVAGWRSPVFRIDTL
jgi:GDP-mannose 6-dehydrogenase